MKNLHLLLFLIMVSPLLKGQSTAVSIETNKIHGELDVAYSAFSTFTAGANSFSGLSWRKDNGELTSLLYNMDYWFYGVDSEQKDYLNARMYDHIDHFAAGLHNTEVDFYNRIWMVKGEEIKALIDDFADGNIDYPISSDILEWPARGNEAIPSSIATVAFAPFYDRNGDGVYNVYDGDYPIVNKGEKSLIPSGMAIFFNNDSNAEESLGVDFSTLAYTLDCDTEPGLDNALFIKYTIRNNVRPLEEFYFGKYFDMDLGSHIDDGLGSDSLRSTIYGYNLDSQDGPDPETGEVDDTVMSYAFTTLSHQLYSAPAIFNGLGDVPPALFNPETKAGFINFLKGRCADGTAITNSGLGFNLGNGSKTKFSFNGDIERADSWTYLNADVIADIRMLGTVVFRNLQVGEIVEYDVVHHAIRDPELNNVDAAVAVLKQADYLKELYDSDYETDCGSILATYGEIAEVGLSLMPNITSDFIYVEGLNEGERYYIYDIVGSEIATSNQARFNCQDLENGIYLLKTESEHRMHKFVVRR